MTITAKALCEVILELLYWLGVPVRGEAFLKVAVRQSLGARRLVLAVTGHDRLLADRQVLSRAVALRDPYVDALSYLQLRALAALREEEPADRDEDRERLERLLLLSVNGVAAGLQNTG